MIRLFLFLYVVVLLCCSVMASGAALLGSDDVWVVGSADSIQHHQHLVEDMKKRGYKVTVHDKLEQVPALSNHLLPSISNVILLGSKLPKRWTAASVVDYVKQGGHLLHAFGATPPATTDDVGLVLSQFGMQATRFPLRDDFAKEQPTLFSTREFGPAAPAIFSAEVLNGAPILSSGYGVVLDAERSHFNVWCALAPSWTSFATHVEKRTIASDPSEKLSFISVFQSRTNARVAVVASDYFLSDASLGSTAATSNRLAARDLVDWTFLRRGILRVQGLKYHSEKEGWAANDTEVPKKIFRVLDSISVQAGLSMLREDGNWVPFVTNDAQVEFIMLSPYVRLTLEPAKDCQALPAAMLESYGCLQNELPSVAPSSYQLYYASSPLPDRVGLFTLRLHYHRPGWLFLDEERLVLMRQYAHNEFPRLLPVSYPYYIMMVSMMVGAVLLAILFLYYKPKQTKPLKRDAKD